MARRKSKRWGGALLKEPKKPITTPHAEYEAIQKRKRKPDGIYYDNIKSTRQSKK